MKPINELNIKSRHFQYDIFMVSILECNNDYDVWVTIEKYDTMFFLFGIDKKDIDDYCYLLDMVREEIDNEKGFLYNTITGGF